MGTNHTSLILPFPMRIAWDRDQIITKITIHEKVHDAQHRCLVRIADAYTDSEIKRHGFDLYGGTYNPRKKRGGTSWSMHAFACASDFDPERNQLKWGRELAYLARPECDKFWRIWEEEGFVSLGRAKNFDWMHVQAALPN